MVTFFITLQLTEKLKSKHGSEVASVASSEDEDEEESQGDEVSR
jgi:hypothetical protein